MTRKAVRVYEAKGLLARRDRTAAGYRLFSSGDVDTLRFIRRARGLGLSLDVAGILGERDAGASTCPAVRARLDARVRDVDGAIAELEQLRETLVAAVGRCDDEARQDQDVICPIIEHHP